MVASVIAALANFFEATGKMFFFQQPNWGATPFPYIKFFLIIEKSSKSDEGRKNKFITIMGLSYDD